MYAHVAKSVRSRDQISMNRSMVGIPYLGARNPHCPEYPLIHEILVGIPSSGDSVQWGFRPVVIPSSGDSGWLSIYCNIFLAVLHCSQEMCQLCITLFSNKENKVI